MRHYLNWSVGFCDTADLRPTESFIATVPGAVQLDYARHYALPDYRRGLNFKQYKWMEDKFWVYSSEFDASLLKDKNLFFIANGIDYQYEIWVNGELLCSYEGMYRKQCIDLTKYIGGKISLEVVVYPIPRSDMPDVHPDTRDEANQCCKPAVSYGWDFHPRLVPLGIWDDIYLLETQCDQLIVPEVSYKLSDDLKTAVVMFSGASDTLWELKNPQNEVIFSAKGEKAEYTLNNVDLWWCNGYGEPKLYTWTASVYGMETVSRKLGFKRIELVKAEGSWNEGLNYPMTCNTPPITVKLNNTVIFAKGTNWVAPEIFYGMLDYNCYRTQLEMVKKANFNFVRCWGGAVINKESFFEICDGLGILVWQEFPLACNNYYSTDRYISVLKSEVSAIIDRIKSHVCLMLWCGGNELFNNWSCMTEQYSSIRLINKLTYEKTPCIPYISTAPLMGMAHGPYNFNLKDGREVIEVLAQSHNTAYTEFGGGGFSTFETLEMIGDFKDLWPMNTENNLAMEHGSHWSEIDIERYFGKAESLEELVRCGQMMQCVVQQFVFEEARRQKPYCSIVSNWCFNEPWPNTGNNSIVSYPNNIKPAYYSVAAACRKVLASARYRRFVYMAWQYIDFDIYLLNDSLEKLEDGTVNVYIRVGDEEKIHLLKWDYSDVPVCTNVIGPTVRYKLPFVENADTVQIILECGEYSSKYTLLYRLPAKPVNAPKKMNAILDENIV